MGVWEGSDEEWELGVGVWEGSDEEWELEVMKNGSGEGSEE